MSHQQGGWVVACVAGVVMLAASVVRADVIQLRNGDRVTGRIVEIQSGRMKIKTTLLGDVSADMKDVATFSTDAPIALRLDDGSVVEQPVTPDADGMVAVASPTDARRQIPIGRIQSVGGPEKWKGTLSVGGVVSRGESDAERLNLGFDVARRSASDRARVEGGYYYGRERDDDTGNRNTTTDNWFVFGKYDYFFDPRFYAFGSTRVDKDRMAELDLRLVPSAGIGYQWVETADSDFNIEIGLAYVYEDYIVPNDNEDHLALRIAYRIEQKLNEQISVFHNMNYFPGLNRASDFNLITDAGLRAHLTQRMFTEFKLEWRIDSTPAPDAARNDLRYLLNVGWKF